MNIGCLVVDDEPYAVNLLNEYIVQVPFLELKYACHNPIDALSYLGENKVDLVLLDINMPQLTGIQLARLLPPGQAFIFTTAYAEFAVESYEMSATDYLLKPITFERFLGAVHKVLKKRETAPALTSPESMFLKTGKAWLQMKYNDIWMIEGLKDYVLFHTSAGKQIVYKRMKELEETLPAQFSRVHNSYIVNRQYILKVEDQQIRMGKQNIPISEKYRENFMKLLNDSGR